MSLGIASLRAHRSNLCATVSSTKRRYNAETYGSGLYGPGSQGGAIPSCANLYTMTTVARGEWGFDGYITSVCVVTTALRYSAYGRTDLCHFSFCIWFCA